MKTTPFHHSNKLSSSVAFNAEEERRRHVLCCRLGLFSQLGMSSSKWAGIGADPPRRFSQGDTLARG